MKRFLFIASILLIALFVNAENKTFIREYTYQASESDSKISARNQAMSEVKKLLLEELGVYVESYVNYTIEERQGHITKDFITNEIKQLSVGITETKILEEKWNGEQYYVRAEIVADPTDVVRQINQTLEKRQSDVVIDSLHILINFMKQNVEAKNAEIEKLDQQLNAQTAANQEQQKKVESLNGQLVALQIQLNKYQQEEQQLLSEIEKIRQKLQKSTTKAVTNAKIGMSISDVIKLCGEPRKKLVCEAWNIVWYNYGYIWLGFENGILTGAQEIEDTPDSCSTPENGWSRSTMKPLLSR